MPHTPGLWRVSEAEGREGCIESVDGSTVYTIGRVYGIRRRMIGNPTDAEIAETKINGQLMAAAPELLRLLVSALAYVEAIPHKTDCDRVDVHACDSLARSIREIVSRVSGK